MTENDTAVWEACAGLATGSKHELPGGASPVWSFERPGGPEPSRKPPRGPEDRYFVGRLNGVVCAVVCDGASSGYYAAEGAEFYSRYAAAYFTRRFEECWDADPLGLNGFAAEFHQQAILALNRQITEQARLAGRPCEPILAEGSDGRARVRARELEQYSTTMLLAMISKGRLVAACIGNGACLAVRGGRIGPLCDFTNKGDDPGLTPFVNRSTYSELLRLMRWQRVWLPPDARGVYLMTDGGGFPGGLYWGAAPQQALLELIPEMENGGGFACIDRALAALRGHEGNLAQDDIALAALLRRDLPPLRTPPRPAERSPLEEMQLYRRSRRPAAAPGADEPAALEKMRRPAALLKRLWGDRPAADAEAEADFGLPDCVDTEAPVRLPPVVRAGGPDELVDLGQKRLVCFTGEDAQQRMKAFLLRLALKCGGTQLRLAAADFMPQRPLAWMKGTAACTAPDGASLYFDLKQCPDGLVGALHAWRGRTRLVVAFAGTERIFRLVQRFCPWLTEPDGFSCVMMGEPDGFCVDSAFLVGPGGDAAGERIPPAELERRIAGLPRVPLRSGDWSETWKSAREDFRNGAGEIARAEWRIVPPDGDEGGAFPEARAAMTGEAEKIRRLQTLAEEEGGAAAREKWMGRPAAADRLPEEKDAEPAECPAEEDVPSLFESLGIRDLNELQPRPNAPACIVPEGEPQDGQPEAVVPPWDLLLFETDGCGGPLVRTVLERSCIGNNPAEFKFWLFSRDEKMIFRILEHLPHCSRAGFGLQKSEEFLDAIKLLKAELRVRSFQLEELVRLGLLPRPEQALCRQAQRAGTVDGRPMPTLLVVLDGLTGDAGPEQSVLQLSDDLVRLGVRLLITGRSLTAWEEKAQCRILRTEPAQKRAVKLLQQGVCLTTLQLPNDQSPWGNSEVQLSALVYRMRELYGES